MKKKWLCFALFLCLLAWPLTPLSHLEAQNRLARTLSATAAGSSLDTMLALGSAAFNQAGNLGLAALRRALDQPPFVRGLTAAPRAREAAQALMAGERALPPTYTRISLQPAENTLRIGAFYFAEP